MIVRDGKNLIAEYLGDRKIIAEYLGDSVVWRNSDKGYIVLPYIVSNGNAWADTGLYLDPTIHRVQGSFIVDSLDMVSTSDIYRFEGARTKSWSNFTKCNFLLRKLSADTYTIRVDWGVTATAGIWDTKIYQVGKEYTFDFTPVYIEVDGVRTERVAANLGVCEITYFIGSMNDPSMPITYVAPATRPTKRIFSVYATGEIIGEVLPTLNLSDNTFNMYDSVTEKYLENRGTEPFTAAYEAWVYEMGRPLSYLQSDGKQWVDTGYKYDSTHILQTQTKLAPSAPVGLDSWKFGARNAYNVASCVIYKDVVQFGNRAIAIPSTAWDITIKRDGLIVDGENIPFEPTTDFVGENNLQLFRAIQSSTYLGGAAVIQGIFKVDNIINLIPFITWEGVKGFLNLVNRELLLNQGTGEFQVPAIPVNFLEFTNGESTELIEAPISDGTYKLIPFNDWTPAQKEVAQGKKLKISFELEYTDLEYSIIYFTLIGFSFRILYEDGTFMVINGYISKPTIAAELNTPYSGTKSLAVVIDIKDQPIISITSHQPYFHIPTLSAGEMLIKNIFMGFDIPDWEIDVIETLNTSGIQAYANHEDNINALNRIGIKIE